MLTKRIDTLLLKGIDTLWSGSIRTFRYRKPQTNISNVQKIYYSKKYKL